MGSLHTVAAAGENLVSRSARSWHVAKVADNSATFPISTNCNDGEGLPQLPSTVGTAEQRENATTGESEQATNSANLGLSRRSLQVMEVANNNVSSRVSATRSREECLQRLPSTVATSGQPGNTQMGPSGHTANLSDLDSLSGSRLHDSEEVNHTAFGPASEPYDEQRRLLYPVDAVDAVGQAGRSGWASSDHFANSANSDVPLHRGLQERQGKAMSIACLYSTDAQQ